MSTFEQIDIEKSFKKSVTIADVIPSMLEKLGMLLVGDGGSSENFGVGYRQVLSSEKANIGDGRFLFGKAKALFEEGKPCSKAVLILVDGLGACMLKSSQSYARFLRKQNAHIISTCLPSTTVSAITTLTTSMFPSDTNMLGWSVISPSTGKELRLLSFDGYGKDPASFQPQKTWFEILSTLGISSAFVGLDRFRDSGFTSASLRGADFFGVKQQCDIVDEVVRLNRRGVGFIYSHWGDIDKLGHHIGVDNYEIDVAVESFDSCMRDLCERVDDGTLVVFVADHGMITVEEENIIYLDECGVYDSIDCVAGEPRALHVHLKNGVDRDRFRVGLENFLGDRAYVLSKDCPYVEGEEVFTDRAWDFLGDFVVFLKKGYVLYDRGRHSEQVMSLKGVHGSVSFEEMAIPCLFFVK